MNLGSFFAWAMVIQCEIAALGYFLNHSPRLGFYYMLAGLISLTVIL